MVIVKLKVKPWKPSQFPPILSSESGLDLGCWQPVTGYEKGHPPVSQSDQSDVSLWSLSILT